MISILFFVSHIFKDIVKWFYIYINIADCIMLTPGMTFCANWFLSLFCILVISIKVFTNIITKIKKILKESTKQNTYCKKNLKYYFFLFKKSYIFCFFYLVKSL